MGKLSKIIRPESLTIPLQMLYYHSCSSIEAWLSLVERCVRDAEVAGSNPVASTIKKDETSDLLKI